MLKQVDLILIIFETFEPQQTQEGSAHATESSKELRGKS